MNNSYKIGIRMWFLSFLGMATAVFTITRLELRKAKSGIFVVYGLPVGTRLEPDNSIILPDGRVFKVQNSSAYKKTNLTPWEIDWTKEGQVGVTHTVLWRRITEVMTLVPLVLAMVLWGLAGCISLLCRSLSNKP